MVLMRLVICIQYMYNSAMKLIYDPDKNRASIRKHGISLAETEAVFYDPFAVAIKDSES